MLPERQGQPQKPWWEQQRLQREQQERMRAQREQAEQERARGLAPGPTGVTPAGRYPGTDLNRSGGFFPAPSIPGAAPNSGSQASGMPPAFPGAQVAPSPVPHPPVAGTGRSGAAPGFPVQGQGMPVPAPAPSLAGRPPAGPATAPPPPPATVPARPAAGPVVPPTPRGDWRAAEAARAPTDGTRTVITQTTRPDGSRRVIGYRQIEDGRTGTTTRIYGDGRRVVWGPDFERRSVGNGVDFVTRQDGRREALLPDGRPIYRDRYIGARDVAGEPRHQIERTRYVRWWRGRPVFEPRPLVRYYDAGFFYGAPVAYYRPARLAPRYYGLYVAPFVTPLPVMAFGPVDEWVIFASTPRVYQDPVVLMGDMQIWSGFEQGLAYSSGWSGTSLYGSQQALAVRNALAQAQPQAGAWNPANPAAYGDPQAPIQVAPVAIGEDIRLRVREQVRDTMALLNTGNPLTLGHVLAAPDAWAYLFQTAQPLMVTDLSGGGECFLNTGDLIRFAAMPDAVSGFATMSVVASGPGSCAPLSVVPVSLSDLQEMLNGFVERLEDNLQRVEACMANGAC